MYFFKFKTLRSKLFFDLKSKRPSFNQKLSSQEAICFLKSFLSDVKKIIYINMVNLLRKCKKRPHMGVHFYQMGVILQRNT